MLSIPITVYGEIDERPETRFQFHLTYHAHVEAARRCRQRYPKRPRGGILLLESVERVDDRVQLGSDLRLILMCELSL